MPIKRDRNTTDPITTPTMTVVSSFDSFPFAMLSSGAEPGVVENDGGDEEGDIVVENVGTGEDDDVVDEDGDEEGDLVVVNVGTGEDDDVVVVVAEDGDKVELDVNAAVVVHAVDVVVDDGGTAPPPHAQHIVLAVKVLVSQSPCLQSATLPAYQSHPSPYESAAPLFVS